jgi:hypothetical protein
VGSCIVVRKDGKPLDNKFMHGLERYAHEKLMESGYGVEAEGCYNDGVEEGLGTVLCKVFAGLACWDEVRNWARRYLQGEE